MSAKQQKIWNYLPGYDVAGFSLEISTTTPMSVAEGRHIHKWTRRVPENFCPVQFAFSFYIIKLQGGQARK